MAVVVLIVSLFFLATLNSHVFWGKVSNYGVLMTLFVSTLNLFLGWQVVYPSYLFKKDLPKKKRVYITTILSIVLVIYGLQYLDSDESRIEGVIFAIRDLGFNLFGIRADHFWQNIADAAKEGFPFIKWEFILYKANLSFWFIRYLVIVRPKVQEKMKRKKKQP